MKKLIVILVFLVLTACCPVRGPRGYKGDTGAPGNDAQPCTTTQMVNGYVLECPGSLPVVLLNGTDGQDGEDGENGQDAPPTAYTVTELVDPCGDKPNAFDEVLFRLANGQLIAHFSSGSLEFLTVLSPGNYVTTDSQACHFNVDNTGQVTW